MEREGEVERGGGCWEEEEACGGWRRRLEKRRRGRKEGSERPGELGKVN